MSSVISLKDHRDFTGQSALADRLANTAAGADVEYVSGPQTADSSPMRNAA
jgi:hypothetical protein